LAAKCDPINRVCAGSGPALSKQRACTPMAEGMR